MSIQTNKLKLFLLCNYSSFVFSINTQFFTRRASQHRGTKGRKSRIIRERPIPFDGANELNLFVPTVSL